LGGGIALQANYGYRLVGGETMALMARFIFWQIRCAISLLRIEKSNDASEAIEGFPLIAI
jgi:hypothetical protein